MKNENVVYPPKILSCDNISLRRTLYALDSERRFKMRELETKKKQFLHEHRTAASRRNWQLRPQINPREIIQEKIERKREQEKQSALDLQSRSSDFIQELRVRPLSVLIKMENKTPPVKEEEPPSIETVEACQPSLSNKVMSLYQKGLEGVLRREREKKANPFVQSVNAIIENLRDEKDSGKRDPMRSFTRTILSKYAGLNAGGAETISEVSENESESASSANESHVNADDKNDDVEKIIETDADDYLEKSKYGSKGLQLWARVRKEQNSISLMNKRESRGGLGGNESECDKTSGRPMLNLNISKCRASPTTRTSSNSTRQTHPKSPTSPSIPTTPRLNNSLSPRSESGKSAEGRRGSKVQSKSKISLPTSKHRAKSGGNRAKEQRTNSSGNCKTLPKLAVEDVDRDDPTHHTVIVVHNDENDDPHTPIHWDDGHRYSLFGDNVLDQEQTDRLKTLDASKSVAVESWSAEDKRYDTLTVDSNKEGGVDDEDENEGINSSSETATIERDELQTGSLSVCSESRLTSSAGTGTRTDSRSGGRKSRRLSVQTSGALRALSSVLNQQEKHMDRLENDASSYRTVVNALADVASSVEEQARKLDNVRRAAPGVGGRESQTKEGDNRKMRRSSIELPDKRSSSFVTNEVYKFLERRSSSKTMARRQTLSKLELKLLSQAPGEDVAGRRNSFSSLNSNHRGSLDLPSPDSSSVAGSVSGSLTDIACNLLDLDRQRTSRRHSMSAVSERLSAASPNSVSRLSNISEKESITGGAEGGKTLRSYSWAPDVSEITNGHVLAMELLARNNRSGASRYRTVTHMLKCLGEEYRRQTASMMYEELRYCTYLRLAPHQIPNALKDSNLGHVFQPES